jgi:NAD(P)-dependent dehydrogenase (short-subunit alcohol dehydrogenase family)
LDGSRDLIDHVAIVTGAGAGLGRAYAHWLAARGAAVVVNNRAKPDGSSTAATVVAEILEGGGKAVAHIGAVEEPDCGAAMVEVATKEFRAPDILICNAGVQRWAKFPAMPLAEMRAMIDINLWGTLHPIQAAWPAMVAGRYGRIVLAGSGAGLWGQQDSVPYCISKSAMIGLARGLALDVPKGADICVNVIAPAAYTAMSSAGIEERWADYMAAERVAPVVGWLASASCRESGMILHAGAGRVRRVRVLQSEWVELDGGSVDAQLSGLHGPPEPHSSYGGGATLMPELFASFKA